MAIVQAPANNVLRPAGALERGRKFRTDFPRVSISQLMENSSVLIEDAMISVDQSEELVALKPMIGVALVGSCELLREPGTSIRVVIDCHYVFCGNDGSQDGKLDLKGDDLRPSFECGAT